jgi:hypothetical protein
MGSRVRARRARSGAFGHFDLDGNPVQLPNPQGYRGANESVIHPAAGGRVFSFSQDLLGNFAGKGVFQK